MAREKNFLLGRGELLSEKVTVKKASGPKNPPYSFPEAQRRIVAKLGAVNRELRALPKDACPHDEAVAVLTMHPRYLSKSDFPSELLSAAGLRPVGSRPRTVSPEQWGIEKPPTAALTDDIFVAGERRAFAAFEQLVPRWTATTAGAAQLAQVEDLAPYSVERKIRGIPAEAKELLLEVVLHTDGEPELVEAFAAYAGKLNAQALLDRVRNVRGLAFVPVRSSASSLNKLAAFSFVRVLRGMPTLRPFRPGIIRSAAGFPVALPPGGPIAPGTRAAIFDGGIPAAVDLAPWVKVIEPKGIGRPVPGFQEHGLAVTTAFLFGPLLNGVPPSIPYCSADHVRVLDERTGHDDEQMLYLDVLDRIVDYLDANLDAYQYVNISLGPRLAIEDDDITAWTARLDECFSRADLLATVAAGNDGELDEAAGLNRIQPPADGVNVLAVGACDTAGAPWQRAAYSCIGPGRSPGIVKPDGVAFGGSEAEPFMVLASRTQARPEAGTSFAAPFTLRTGAGVGVQLGNAISPLATRALLIHRADDGDHPLPHVGWGRFHDDAVSLLACEDDEALVLYQGDLPVGQHLRARLPMPSGKIAGFVTVSATLLISPQVDAKNVGAYTRAGFEVAFRPNSAKVKVTNGKASPHAQTKPFFSATNLYGAAEYVLREDGGKWEPCRRHTARFKAAGLKDPCFDIYYHHRDGAAAALWKPKPIRYALVVGLKAPSVPDFYNRVVRTYATVLVPLRPRVNIQIRT